MLLEFSLHNPLEDPNTDVTIRTCSSAGATANTLRLRGDGGVSSTCGAAFEVNGNLQLASGTASLQPQLAISKEDATAAIALLQSHLRSEAHCNATIAFAYSGTAAVGVFAGSGIHNSKSADSSIRSFLDHVGSKDIVPENSMLQWCGTPSAPRTADHSFGIVVTSSADLPKLQNFVKTWSQAGCVTEADGVGSLTASTSPMWLRAPLPASNSSSSSAGPAAHKRENTRYLSARADCRTIQVVSGDSCGALASKCGISGADFTKFNPASNLCSTLAVGQYVCCSSGTLPDRTPKPNADGSCAAYVVQSGDWCAAIGSSRNLTPAQLESFNKNTWGWSGCSNLQIGIAICLSTGTPPMPAPISNAICGPQVPGTARPTNGQALASLNPCPLNVCCSKWGQCGLTDEFCLTETSPTNAPGTTGCISNCGSAIVNNASPPSSFITLAYFEAWNAGRKCLYMDVDQIDPKRFSHIHFAFADITSDYRVDVSAVKSQFDRFVRMTGSRRIISFGGWSFSTEHDTFPIFREGVSASNRQLFANNVAQFIKQYNLDGVDFDWEYPGAPDIPGIPPGSPNDGKNYLDFLKMVRAALPTGKSVSIAAPASYWYLKGFPIKDMSAVVDYIVYMTYDLHGQWDYGSPWASPGCANGDCLRSHVNMTETRLALSMVTKAGVPASKIVVGVSSYGRSFKMTTKGCDGPSCKFVGPDSGATLGACTETAGYISDAEIRDIIGRNPDKVKSWYDPSSESNILVYDDVQWVAWMDTNTKAKRATYYRSLNFGGTTDWAVDLQYFRPGDACPSNMADCDKIQFASESSIGRHWRSYTCTDPNITDASIDQKTRWYGIAADGALEDAFAYWRVSNRALSFPKTVSNFFNGPEGMDCNVASIRNGCASFLQCHDTNKPAGYFVLNSMIALDNVIMNFYDAISRIQISMTNDAGGIASTFAPLPQTDKAAKILLDCISLGFALGAAPVWNAALKRFAFFASNGNTLGTIKDMTNSLVSNGITIAKDAMPSPPGDFTKDVVKAVRITTDIWYNSTSTLLGSLFSGSDDSIATLRKFFQDGKFLANSYNPLSDQEIQASLARALYSMLIPLCWRLAPDKGIFVLDTEKKCSQSISNDDVSGSDQNTAKYCDKDNDRLYLLLNAEGKESDIIRDADGTPIFVSANRFRLPPGLDQLDGTKWGGIRVADLVKGSLNTFRANGGKNNAPEKTPTLDSNTVNSIQDLDILAPGVITFPVCKLADARKNWAYKTDSGPPYNADTYPCSQ